MKMTRTFRWRSVVTKHTLAFVLFAALVMPMASQSQPSIQGVWRNSERTIPASTTPGDRVDPFAHVPAGTQTAVQPGLLIITGRYYSRVTDTAVAPRPSAGYATPDRPTLEELQARWGPFAANAGTYELSGSTLTLRVLVSKNPSEQRDGAFAKLTMKVDGNTLWLTPFENNAGPIVAGVTSKYVRVE
jgi:hypothetical protein